MADKKVFTFREESDYEDAKNHLCEQMQSDCDSSKIVPLGRYGGEYRIDVLSECSNVIQAANIIKEHRGINVAPKTRNGFVSFWLWYILISNSIMGVCYLAGAFLFKVELDILLPLEHNVYIALTMAYISLFNTFFAEALLRWKKWGFWGFCASSVIVPFVNIFGVWIFFITESIGTVIFWVIILMTGSVYSVGLWAILQIRRDGVSCWKHLK